MDSPFALASKTQAGPIGNPRRDLHRQGFGLFNASLTVAGWAGMGNNLALTMAPGTGGTDSKKPLGLDHLSPAAAGGAVFGLGAGFKAVSLTKGTGLHPGNFQFHFFTLGRFHERNGEIITKIRSFPGPRRIHPGPFGQTRKSLQRYPRNWKKYLQIRQTR